jgi:ribosomal subunit interface protein
MDHSGSPFGGFIKRSQMQVYLTARQMELTPAMRAHVERHLGAPVERYTGIKVVRMEVQLYRTGEHGALFGCHVLLEVSHRHPINVREEGRDLYAAIDLAEDRLTRALTDYQGRRLTENRHPRKYNFGRLFRALGWGRRRSATNRERM